MANGDPNMQSQVDKNCLTADILTYKCERMIDAANYMGVTVDITRGTGMAGFRGKLVKPWCREMNTFKVTEKQNTSNQFKTINVF